VQVAPPVGLSTSVAYARRQYQSFGRAESRRRLTWWSRTLDTLTTVGMCPVVAAASVLRVLAFRGVHQRRREALTGRAGVPGTSCEARFGCRSRPPVGLSTSVAYSRSQYQSFWRGESRRRLIWWSRTLDTLSTVEMCPVVAAASVARVRLAEGSPAAPFDGSQVALAYPACPARLGASAGRVDQTFSVIAALSRVCTDQIRQTTTLGKTKRRVLASCIRSPGRNAKAAPVRSAEALQRLGENPPTRKPPTHHAKNSSHTEAAAPASTQYTANGSRLFVRK
jgi:hypothetical protein